VRSRVREADLECRDARRQFNTTELIRCISVAASEALTEEALRTVFRRVGMWPLDPTVVSDEELSKGEDAPVAETDLELLTRRLIPVVRKDMSGPRVVNGTLSTAGRGTVLTADDVIAAISEGAAAREASKLAKSHAKRAREAKAKEKKSLESIAARAKRAKLLLFSQFWPIPSMSRRVIKCAKLCLSHPFSRIKRIRQWAVVRDPVLTSTTSAKIGKTAIQEKQEKFMRKTWDETASDAANYGACFLRAMGLLASTAAKPRRRALASRARRGAPPPLSPNELWRVVSAEAAEVGTQQLR